ncbi:MAG: hypothetical protein ACO3F3_09355 [Gemmataceae bacterium]
MKFFSILLFIFPLFCFGQPKVHPAGDGWHLKVDSAMRIIQKYDPEKYSLLVEVCDEIGFWSGNFSSNGITAGISSIYVASKDIQLNSINNIACVLVHESLHLYILQKSMKIDRKSEEKACYLYELEFLSKLPNPEPWLIENTKTKIKLYS